MPICLGDFCYSRLSCRVQRANRNKELIYKYLESFLHNQLLNVLSKVTNSTYQNYVCFTVYKFMNTGTPDELNLYHTCPNPKTNGKI
jgi:hypothetical protein